MKKLLSIVALVLLALAVAAQEPEPPADAGASTPVAQDAGDEGAATGAAEDALPGEEAPAVTEAEPDAEALAAAAAAAGGQIGEVDEEFTPEDEISEDYPVPLPADI